MVTGTCESGGIISRSVGLASPRIKVSLPSIMSSSIIGTLKHRVLVVAGLSVIIESVENSTTTGDGV